MKRASASEEEVGGTHFRWGMDSEGRESESRWNMKSSIDISRLYFLRARSSECTVLNVETDGGIETEMESQKSMTSRKLLERHPPATREQVMQMQEAPQARPLCIPWDLRYAVSRPPHAQECWVHARHRKAQELPSTPVCRAFSGGAPGGLVFRSHVSAQMAEWYVHKALCNNTVRFRVRSPLMPPTF